MWLYRWLAKVQNPVCQILKACATYDLFYRFSFTLKHTKSCKSWIENLQGISNFTLKLFYLTGSGHMVSKSSKIILVQNLSTTQWRSSQQQPAYPSCGWPEWGEHKQRRGGSSRWPGQCQPGLTTSSLSQKYPCFLIFSFL